MKEFYSINELAVMTGFTTRSLRNFIQMEFLKGEKVNGEWQFSTEQIENFFSSIFITSKFFNLNPCQRTIYIWQ